MKSTMPGSKPSTLLPPVCALLLLAAFAVRAQVPVDENGRPLDAIEADAAYADATAPVEAVLSDVELEELAGPVALYPDDLLAIVLPASTYPLEIVQAARFLEQLEADSSLQPDESWDESVTALLNYPEIIRMMDEDIDWTWRLGEAVIAQQEDLIAAIENFRDRAYAAGNLKSDEYQEVKLDDGVIEIVPVNEEIIYVPYYEPEEVVVYQPRRAYYYYPQAYPVYYYPYPVGHHFASGYFWGVTTAFSIGWNSRYLHVYHPSYWGHPYYGRSYYSHYYRRPSINIYNSWYVHNSYRTVRNRYRDGDYWRPRHRSGARPVSQRVRNRHYTNSPSSARDQATREGRSRLQTRDNGRMDLGLRERSTGNNDRERSQRGLTTRQDTNRRGASAGTRSANSREAVNRQARASNRGGNREATGEGRPAQRANSQRGPAPAVNGGASNSSRSAIDARSVRSSNRASATGQISSNSRSTTRRAAPRRETVTQQRTGNRVTATPTRVPTSSRRAPTRSETAQPVRPSSRATQPAARASVPTRPQSQRGATRKASGATNAGREAASQKPRRERKRNK